ncbi:GNAT family N-acetyltransferase [uncultured Roseovarius sp.]|uniref:GNAT family N-acetyltransferase n=1 Tax=uncultured Roseovarius sp. TaxID=293344 RepID=UPI002636B908|nr:GNAT family N-acetyltransferase [uncultured Roseovarius sp.]
MPGFHETRYRARIAVTPEDLQSAQRLRALCFLGDVTQLDHDHFDDLCTHVMIEKTATGELVCCFRILMLTGGCEIAQSYSAQFYELSALGDFQGKMAELGRFCIAPGLTDPDILRVAWGAMTRFVEENHVEMLFGCSSFKGVETDAYLDAFAVLRARHLAPRRWWPRVKSPSVFRFARALERHKPDLKVAMRRMPPLLRTYLMMGGWVSDHAVIDRQLDTLHVFTGVEIRAIPDARKRVLRGLAI